LSFLSIDPSHLIMTYGYWAIFVVVALESMGTPLPGETALVLAAAYAGTTGELDIRMVILAAFGGAVFGDNLGYLLGRMLGLPLLLKHGDAFGLDTPRLKLGRYLFDHHGGWIVFFGRFVAILRALAALLAGVNRMPWTRFLLCNAAGGAIWSVGFGLAAYELGDFTQRLSGPVQTMAIMLLIVLVVIAILFFRRNERRWLAKAEAALPGPLQA
jgi:membrane protein DedA with SNARE-associated domain